MFLMFLMFPLYLENRYNEIGTCKWTFYLMVTIPCVGILWLGLLVRQAAVRAKRPCKSGKIISGSDLLLMIYGICVIITLLFTSCDRHAAWTGAEGWYMGAAAQLLLVASYFVLSRVEISEKQVIACGAGGSVICFLIGIFQRLGWDLLGLYEGMSVELLSDFVSTIGNRTWMSGYVSVIFPIGVYFFWKLNWSTDLRKKLLWGAYTALAFSALVACYSDSGYAGLLAMLAVLGCLSLGDMEKICSFCEILCLLFGSSLVITGIRFLRGDQVRDARGLTCYFYQWEWMLTGLVISGLLLVFTWVFRQKIQKIWVLPVILVPVLAVLFIVLNTAGYLQQWFGFQFRNSYLFFDDQWGDMRGWTWKTACRMFAELRLPQKLFGVGSDCFGAYAYSNMEYAESFGAVWGDAVLTNAHNEWLNMVFCQGLIGGVVYLVFFICTAIRFLKSKGHPLVPAVGLCIVTYMAHNFFCYQQICATGLLFVLMGAAASLDRRT